MQQKRFGGFSEDFQLISATSPMLVSVTKNPELETKEQYISTHDRFTELNEIIKNKLASIETSAKIQKIGKKYALSILQMSNIARAIRSFYFGELQAADFPFYLAKEIPIELSRAKEITAIVWREIINDDTEEKAYQKNLLQLPLTRALTEIPELGEQLLTSQHIQILSFPDPVRPSIKNWLADYTSYFGYEKHSPIEMSNYLFHSQNTQRLSSSDRQKLTHILKSFNDDSPITVNKTLKQVVFPTMTNQIPSNKIQTPNNIQTSNLQTPIAQQIRSTSQNTKYQTPDAEGLTFSSPQKLPYENNIVSQKTNLSAPNAKQNPINRQLQSDRNHPNTIVLTKKPDLPRPEGKNVVNLKEI